MAVFGSEINVGDADGLQTKPTLDFTRADAQNVGGGERLGTLGANFRDLELLPNARSTALQPGQPVPAVQDGGAV